MQSLRLTRVVLLPNLIYYLPQRISMDVSAVDLFCGAGGLTYGLEQAGISVETGFDNNPDCRYAFEANSSADFRSMNVEKLTREPEGIRRQYPWNADLKVLAACAPCQPYSTLSHAKDKTPEEHDKWGLLDEVRKIVEEVEPDVLAMENVLQVRNDNIYHRLIDTLEDLGYFINPDEDKNVYGPEYGIPQKRKRWVLLASKEGPIELGDPLFPSESDYPTVRETIGHLPAIKHGETHPNNPLHQARSLSDLNEERISNMEPGEDWTVWEEMGKEHLLLDCHKKESGRSYKAPYGRMSPDEPAPTITTQFYNYGSGRFGHYDTDQNRAISLLEGAMLQTFPENYQFVEDWEEATITQLGRWIGNAVPPLLGQRIGEAILDHVDSEQPTRALAND
ncbi:DNA cytosine methyltransferase [Halorubrum sp. LN27]|uniref:DNA cytosine methyltransferase n=1 Tax=Halorubrum sp. LN27 TaxID=2801032 RepID=UPI001F2C2B26|nr:DNA cytosine methyltransferase [Halorubrum sp. LN27]